MIELLAVDFRNGNTLGNTVYIKPEYISSVESYTGSIKSYKSNKELPPDMHIVDGSMIFLGTNVIQAIFLLSSLSEVLSKIEESKNGELTERLKVVHC